MGCVEEEGWWDFPSQEGEPVAHSTKHCSPSPLVRANFCSGQSPFAILFIRGIFPRSLFPSLFRDSKRHDNFSASRVRFILVYIERERNRSLYSQDGHRKGWMRGAFCHLGSMVVRVQGSSNDSFVSGQ